jgi:hypothetical protein
MAGAGVFATLVVLALIGVASAQERVTVRSGNVDSTLDLSFFPKAVSKTAPTPVRLSFSSRTNALDGTRPPAFSELVLRVDRNAVIDVKGLPACNPLIQYQAANSVSVKAACRGDAIIGSGRATVEIAFPEVAPIVTEAELTVINGGVRGGVTTLYATAYLTVPTPATLAAKVKIEKIHNGHFGTEATVAIPKVAGGSGSVTSFNATIDRRFSRRGKTVGVATLKCPDGKVLARADELFADGTHLEAKLSQPCIPKR